jgi:protein arginine N-methyltransferase 2
MSGDVVEATVRLHAAAAAGDTQAVTQLLTAGVPAYAQSESDGRSALMIAADGGHAAVVQQLLEAGAPWNALDRRGYCAGNYALEANHQPLVDLLVDAAVRAELLLGASERRTAATAKAAAAAENESEEYLSRGVRYEGERLLDAADDAVMMEWERPLMEEHARRLCASGGDVMNVGFGMGIVDGAIAAFAPRSHTIVEAHPQVFAALTRDGWPTRPGVCACNGRWQEVVPQLIAKGRRFDGIFYDTYGEHDADMAEFHAHLPALLRPGGVYSFFNGMCPNNVFFQGVACQVVELELQARRHRHRHRHRPRPRPRPRPPTPHTPRRSMTNTIYFCSSEHPDDTLVSLPF